MVSEPVAAAQCTMHWGPTAPPAVSDSTGGWTHASPLGCAQPGPRGEGLVTRRMGPRWPSRRGNKNSFDMTCWCVCALLLFCFVCFFSDKHLHINKANKYLFYNSTIHHERRSLLLNIKAKNVHPIFRLEWSMLGFGSHLMALLTCLLPFW